MNTSLILATISMVIFLVYNIVVNTTTKCIPPSLSDTFYILNDKKNGLGYLFTIMMFLMAFTLVPALLNITEVVTAWSHYLTVIPFLMCASICFVGAAPMFMAGGMDKRVHFGGAYTAVAMSLIFDMVICWKLMWIVPLWVLIIAAAAHGTKTAKSSLTYWLEMICFGSTFTTAITECILLW